MEREIGKRTRELSMVSAGRGVGGGEMQWRAMYLAAALSPLQKGTLLDAHNWSRPSSSSPLVFKTS